LSVNVGALSWVQILDSKSFNALLELSPRIRDVVAFFCNAEYSRSLELLDGIASELTLGSLRPACHVCVCVRRETL
jgi:hypothetical protein